MRTSTFVTQLLQRRRALLARYHGREWIGDERLAAVPAAATCIDCASDAERLKRVAGS